MTTKYLVKRGPEGNMAGISIMTASKEYADGYAAGLNHSGKRYWHYVEEIEALAPGTKVRIWPGSMEGRSIDTTIRDGYGIALMGGVPVQWVDDYSGCIALTHMKVIEEES